MSFTGQTRQRSNPVLPLSALVDVLFLLLIFFMTTSIFREQDRLIDVALPAADSSLPSDGMQAPIVVTVTDDGSIYMSQKQYNLRELRAVLESLHTEFPNEAIEIRSDRNSRLGRTVQVMDAAHAVGLYNVSLATIKQASDIQP